MKIDYTFLLKVGERQYMESLINEGLVYCRNIHYFNQIGAEDLRGDKNDGASYLKQLSSLILSVDGKEIGKANQGQLYLNRYQGNIYCLYGIQSSTLNREIKQVQKFNLNMEGLSFGDTAVVIYNIGEFVRRVKKALELKGLKGKCSPVIYYSHEEYEGKLSPFHKSSKYKEQKEVRFWIPNKLKEDLSIKIGNMSDISYLLPKAKIDNLCYQAI